MVFLKKFLDRLPVPKVLQPKSFLAGCPYYEVPMVEFQQSLHSQLSKTTVWGYAGSYPGPTFEVIQNQQIYVSWKNCLPRKHILPVDQTVHGAESDRPEVRTVVHVHGARVPPEYDGHPEAWFTREFEETGPFFTSKIYRYPNRQKATTLWYHDHALGITRLNLYAGLAGFYIIRHPQEKLFNLPQGCYEIPLMIQDKSFNSDGSLFYPSQPNEASKKLPNPSIVPEFFGDTIQSTEKSGLT
jgi:spore coat protein A